MVILEKLANKNVSANKSSNPIALRACDGKCSFEARKRSNLTKVGGTEHRVGGAILKVDGTVAPPTV